MVDLEKGNYDDLMNNDVDVTFDIVKEELVEWRRWYQDMAHFDEV